MTDVIIRTLSLRGPGAARLARVAVTALPRALEDALSGFPDTSVARLHLDLPVGIAEDLDDEALAVLWADAIRAAVVRAAPQRSVHTGRPDPPLAPHGPAGPDAVRARAEAAARQWIDTPTPRPPLPAEALVVGSYLDAPENGARALASVVASDDPLPAEPLVVGSHLDAPENGARALASVVASDDPLPAEPLVVGSWPAEHSVDAGTVPSDVAADMVLALDAAIRAERALVQSVAGGRVQSSAAASDSLEPSALAPYAQQPGEDGQGVPLAGAGHAPRSAEHTQGRSAAQSRRRPEKDEESATDAEAAARARLGVIANLLRDGGRDLDVACLTQAAGLPLLYPWLADHCRAATAMHPALDAFEVRARALASVVAPDDPTLANDPLVVMLAGLDPVRGARPHAPLAHQNEMDDSATDVLRRFVALLPGFESSTAEFVRRSWIARAGMVDTDLEPVRLTAATHPLDVVLPLLPYPIGLVQLPWGRAVTVRFRP